MPLKTGCVGTLKRGMAARLTDGGFRLKTYRNDGRGKCFGLLSREAAADEEKQN